jgi:hypothetical protein
MKFNLHGRNTRYGLNLHPPASYLALYQKSAHYTGLKVLNSLPFYIEGRQHDVNEFKQRVQSFLYCNTFYTLEEYFNEIKGT